MGTPATWLERAQIVQMRVDGMKVQDIAATTGRSVSGVENILRAEGLTGSAGRPGQARSQKQVVETPDQRTYGTSGPS